MEKLCRAPDGLVWVLVDDGDVSHRGGVVKVSLHPGLSALPPPDV